jgi:hypothetical protein
LIAQSEQLSGLPEISSVYGTSLDQRARGLGSMTPTICAEDSLMCMRGDPWVGDRICPHEYGHTLADLAIARGEPAMASQLKTIYNDIVASGNLANAYVHEDGGTSGLMAWGVQAWYDCAINGSNGGYHSDIDTRAELAKELPDFKLFAALPGAGAALAPRLRTAFGENRDRFPDAASVQNRTGIAPVVERSGNKSWTRWRFIASGFLRQTFVEWAGETVPHSFGAQAFYESRRAKGVSHQAILRALAFKWIRILWRCWHDRQPYDEARYLMALQKRHSPSSPTPLHHRDSRLRSASGA